MCRNIAKPSAFDEHMFFKMFCRHKERRRAKKIVEGKSFYFETTCLSMHTADKLDFARLFLESWVSYCGKLDSRASLWMANCCNVVFIKSELERCPWKNKLEFVEGIKAYKYLMSEAAPFSRLSLFWPHFDLFSSHKTDVLLFSTSPVGSFGSRNGIKNRPEWIRRDGLTL